MIWWNVNFSGFPVNLTFGPSYSLVEKTVMGYLCSKVDIEARKCVGFEPQPDSVLDVDFTGNYPTGVHGIYPIDPLGVLDGPVEFTSQFTSQMIESERNAQLIGARPLKGSDDDSKTSLYLGGAVLVAVIALALWRGKR